jgi:hypothetical protein
MRTFALVAAAFVLAAPALAQSTRPDGGGKGDGQPTSPAAKSSKVNLRPKWKKGQEVRFKLSLESSSTDSAQGSAPQTQSMAQELGLVLRCKETDAEAGSQLELVYESMKARIRSPLMNVDFDSSKPAKADDPADTALRSVVGLTLPVRMDKDGNITSVGSGEGGESAVGALVGQFTGADVIKGLFGPIFMARKGAGEAAVGESWTTEDTIDGAAGTIRLTMTHTLDSHAGGRANISMKGKATLTAAGAGGPQAAIRDSAITGKTVWDTEAGMLSTMESRQRLTVETRATKDAAGTTTTQDMKVNVVRVK